MSEQNDISKMNKLELLEKCKELSITKCSSKNKSQLLELINSKQEAEAKAKKDAILERLGITADEAKLLLG